MNYEKPIIQKIDSENPVQINQKYTIRVTVIDAQMVVVFYAGEVYSGEVNA